MRKTVTALGLVMTVVLAGCDLGGSPPIPVVRVDDDAIDKTLGAPQVVEPPLTFDQHLRMVGTLSQGPAVWDVFQIDFPADGSYRIAFDCTAVDNIVVEIYDDQQAFVSPADACGPDHLTSIVSGSGFHLLLSNATIGSVDASYDITLQLVAVP